MPGGTYVVVDPYGERSAVSETEFRQRHRYEAWSVWLPWYLTPPALLLILAGWLRRTTHGT
jgi:hypothetical protein